MQQILQFYRRCQVVVCRGDCCKLLSLAAVTVPTFINSDGLVTRLHTAGFV